MKKKLSVICSILFLFNAFIHLLLVLGAPLGEYVLGGKYLVVPVAMRIVNLFFFFLWLFSGYCYLAYSKILKTWLSNTFLKHFLLGITLFTIIAIFSNLFITTSSKERLLMTPLTIVVSICSFAVIKMKE